MTHNLYTIGFTLFLSQHDQLYVHSTCQVQHTWFCNCAVALHSLLDSPLSSTSPTCWQDTGAFSITSLPYLTLFHLRYNGQEYDVSWTMPQCVLCLRLIGQLCWLYSDSAVKYLATFSWFNGMKLCLGLSWDVYDGERQRMKPTSLSPDQVLTDWTPERIKQIATQYFFRRNQHLPALQTFLSSSPTHFLSAAILSGPSSPWRNTSRWATNLRSSS